MNGLPDAIFVIDVGYEHIAIKEAKRLYIPVVGVVDTNNSPDNIDYVIPGNDDAQRAIELYVSSVADVILEAKNDRERSLVEEITKEDNPELDTLDATELAEMYLEGEALNFESSEDLAGVTEAGATEVAEPVAAKKTIKTVTKATAPKAADTAKPKAKTAVKKAVKKSTDE
jgi:hypothetical protein